MTLFNLKGKRALITGGTHGLGMAMAEGLAMAGAELVITGTTPSKMEEALTYYKSKGYTVSGYLFDVTDENAAAKNIELIGKELGDIHILVNNAGIIKRELAITMPIADFRQVIDVDLVGPFIMSQLVAKQMIARNEGKIINICSMMSELGRNSVSAYAAAKGGLKMLTRNLATDPEDLAGTAVFLASKASDFVNGQIVYVDGGILATIGKPSNEN